MKSKMILLIKFLLAFWRKMIRRLNFMRSKLTFSWGLIHEIKFFVIFHEVEIPNNWFDLMIEVSTSWSILLDKFDLMNKHNFDLMIKNLISWKSWILISWNSTSWPPLFLNPSQLCQINLISDLKTDLVSGLFNFLLFL